jgi:hypothetical protein
MELNLTRLELSLSLVQRLSILVGFAQGLDRIPGTGEVIDR